jgi:hypothetical protein
MDRRDRELLSKQLRSYDRPGPDGAASMAMATVFFAGMVLGGMLFSLSTHDGARARTASNDAPAAISLLNGAPTVVRR